MMENLWRMSIYGSTLIPAVLLMRRLIRNYPREYSYSLWMLVLARLLIPLFFKNPFSLQLRLGAGVEGGWYAAARLLYAAGALTAAFGMLVQYIQMKRSVRLAVRTVENIWLCENIPSAFVMGLFRPRIYLPYHLEGRERWYVLQHEKTHIRHLDPWMRMIAAAALCLHWWNPLVWYAVRSLFGDMEMYCDESVMEQYASCERKTYAGILLKMSCRQSGFCALCFGASHTEQRIRNLLMNKKEKNAAFGFLFSLAANLLSWLFLTVP